jgi:hypothetical protein
MPAVTVRSGFSLEPSPEALPSGAGATKTPVVSETTQGSVDGSSVSDRQSSPHAWLPALQVKPHGPPSPPASRGVPPPSRLQVAWPCCDFGPAQLVAQSPQCVGCVGSTHAPEQLSGVEPSASQPTVQTPLVQVGAPAPASGPEHTFVQVPQCEGRPGSTQLPLHSSVVGAEHPASAEGEPSDGFIASL